MRRILNNAISLIVVVIVLFLVIPLHPSVLDVLLILNISLSIMILMITMNISEPLEFSIFPSLLLITTLFRLGLNVSSTRLILRIGGRRRWRLRCALLCTAHSSGELLSQLHDPGHAAGV